ncbi:retrovirus-related pol polyprotein from transposon TNT 1-94 [Tanacetum coccineum]|uniref:Retrovirus-related pol polyprotein from transposon TNT 1-94 n=1 Tax=Tanacetum coccineum TaxID=301880 RepID=A0ABQ4WIA5_9ASTR
MLYSVKSMKEYLCVKPSRRYSIHSLSLIKVRAIKEAKDLATLPLGELIGNLNVYEMILENDGLASKATKEKVKSLALKAKVTREQTSDDSDSQGGNVKDVDEDEAEAFNLMARNFQIMEMILEIKAVEAQDKSVSAIITRKKVTSLVSVQIQRKTRLLSEELGAIVKTTMNCKRMQHVSWKSILKRTLFTTYKEYDGGHVIFGSNLKGKVVGGGNISHDSIRITNVEHVTGLAFNLISIGQLCDDYYVVKFTKVDCTISKIGKILAKGHRRNGLYTCKLEDNFKQQICLASMVDNSMLWHKRLGHANMRKSRKKSVLPDNPMSSPDNVLDNQIFDTLSTDSHPSNVEMYVIDEEDDGDNMIIPQTLSEEIKTRIDNTRYPPPLLKEIGEDEI